MTNFEVAKFAHRTCAKISCQAVHRPHSAYLLFAVTVQAAVHATERIGPPIVVLCKNQILEGSKADIGAKLDEIMRPT